MVKHEEVLTFITVGEFVPCATGSLAEFGCTLHRGQPTGGCTVVALLAGTTNDFSLIKDYVAMDVGMGAVAAAFLT